MGTLPYMYWIKVPFTSCAVTWIMSPAESLAVLDTSSTRSPETMDKPVIDLWVMMGS